ncbi:MAG: hypothetical protein R3F59_36385 [Myxococcota bacterium]
MAPPSPAGARTAALTVFLAGFVSLAFELVQVRLLAFLLGNGNDFLAIPIALLGLAIGSMGCHFLYRGDLGRLVRALSAAVGPLLLVTLLGVFAIGNHVFPAIHASRTDPGIAAARIVVYGVAFLPPYVGFGALFAAAFARAEERVGQLYFFDLAGAALGCAAVPLALAWTDLWPTLMLLLVGAFALYAADPVRPGRNLGLAAAGLAVVGLLAATGAVFRTHPNPSVLASWALSGHRKGAEEVAVRWNPIARTSLMRSADRWAIVQDNGVSNVQVRPWDPSTTPLEAREESRHHSLAWDLGRDPRDILVIFAGAGRDLLLFDALSGERASLTGVEINPDVVGFIDHPALADFGLGAFFADPKRRLVNQEGRHFLDVDRGTYDLIHVANNGAVAANRTGHTRKFLDTCEAMAAYLDHLAPDGVLVFANQPIEEKLGCFRELFAQRGLGDATAAMFAWGWPDIDVLDSLVVMPGGMTPADAQTLRQQVASWRSGAEILWDPTSRTGVARTTRLLTEPVDRRWLVTDDRPFTHPIVLGDLDVVPAAAQLADPRYLEAWLKVFTVALFALVSGGIAGAAHWLGGPERRVPLPWVAYLLVSGVGYMAVEIGLIAKTELFVGNPLYAVALNLALFLVASAVGAALQDRWRDQRAPVRLVAFAVAGIVWGLLGARLCNAWLVGAPMVIKAVALAVAVVPTGIALGAFYPYAVERLVGEGRPGAVPMSYALTTLSSVLGSSLAIAAMIDLGFTRVILVGAALYVVAGAIAFARQR